MRFTNPILFIAAAALIVTACRKDKHDDEQDLYYTSASDIARAEDAFSDIMAQVEKAVINNGLRDDCDPAVTFDTVTTPHVITIDFGDLDCAELYGRRRRGRIHVSYTGHYRDQGTVITITPEGYYVNSNLVLGTTTVTNMGPDASGNPHFTVAVNGSITQANGGWVATITASRTRTWIEGSDTPEWNDDVYLITGGGSGVNRNNVPYTESITNALRVDMYCPLITQGTVQITPASDVVRTIDYGNGTCDGTFTITVNGQTFTLTIG